MKPCTDESHALLHDIIIKYNLINLGKSCNEILYCIPNHLLVKIYNYIAIDRYEFCQIHNSFTKKKFIKWIKDPIYSKFKYSEAIRRLILNKITFNHKQIHSFNETNLSKRIINKDIKTIIFIDGDNSINLIPLLDSIVHKKLLHYIVCISGTNGKINERLWMDLFLHKQKYIMRLIICFVYI